MIAALGLEEGFLVRRSKLSARQRDAHHARDAIDGAHLIVASLAGMTPGARGRLARREVMRALCDALAEAREIAGLPLHRRGRGSE
jgi:hypothetical protein